MKIKIINNRKEDMQSSITLHIVEPGSTPVDPVVPNTGLFTSGIGGAETAIIATVSLVAILAIIIAVLYYRNKKQGKLMSLKHKKVTTIGLTKLVLLVSIGIVAGLLRLGASAVDDSLTVTASSEELTIELADEPVFAVLPVELTIAEATEAGYTLTAYTEGTDLVSTTDSSKVIPMVVADEGELVVLADNTYGLSLSEPEDEDSEIYTTLSTAADTPTLITNKDYKATEANDTTTIYYGFYITPDTPYGTYTGGEVEYKAEADRTDLVKVTFDGNGLTFNGNTTNVTQYAPDSAVGTTAYSHTPNVNDEGVQNGMYRYNLSATNVYQFADDATKVHVKVVESGNDSGCDPHQDDYFSFWAGSHPNYTALANYSDAVQAFGNTSGKYVFGSYNDVETDIEGVDAVTFSYTTNDSYQDYCTQSGYGYYAIITAQDADGNNVSLIGNELYEGSYLVPSSDASYSFLGWSEDKNATEATYFTAQDISLGLSLESGSNVTLYAIWQPTFTISYNGNGASTATNMDNVEQYTTQLDGTAMVDLLASNFQKEGYGFVGWSTDNEAWAHLTNESTSDDPTIYGPNQTITIDEGVIAEAGANRKLTLNAIWADVATDKDGETLTFQTENLLTTPLSDDTNDTLAAKDNGYVTALKDERDGEVYAVAKLADGNYWMIENLRLDDSATISTTNTNNPLVVDNAVAIKNNNGNTSNHLSPTSNSWCTDSNTECYDQSNLNTNNIAETDANPVFGQQFSSSASHGSFNANLYSYSNYYNWYSATAGQGTYSDGSNVTVEGDLCPAGWQLPYGGNQSGTEEGQNKGNTSGGFYYLNQQMGGDTSSTDSNNWRSFPNNFVYSGGWGDSSAYGRGYSGYYWSSTAYGSDYAYFLYLRSDRVYPGTYNYGKYGGYSVRCVAQ